MKIIMVHLRNIGDVSGGLEKVLCDFSRAMILRGHKVTVVVYDNTGKKPYYSFHPAVKYINLWNIRHEPRKPSLLSKVSREWNRARGRLPDWIENYRRPYIVPALRQILEQEDPDIIVNYHFSDAGFIMDAGISCPVITMLHNEPKKLLAGASQRELQAIEQSKAIQVLVPGFKKTINKMFPHTPCWSIPNTIPQYEEQADLADHKNQYHIIHVGRISSVAKRQHLLIQAFSMIAKDFPQWDLSFWGSGNKKYLNELKQLIKDHHLENAVFFKGVTHDLEKEYIHSDLFAFPSAFEGFGLAMGEAMSCGLPVVAYKSCPAVNEIVEDGIDGFLVNDGVEPLAKAMRKLMSDQDLRSKMGQAARESMKKYAPGKIWDLWESRLLQSVNKK